MSEAALCILNKKSATWIAGFQNGRGTGPRCWSYLAEKYLPGHDLDHGRDGYAPLWALVKGDRLAFHERLALLMTFDYAYIPLANLERAAEACEKFGIECDHPEKVNHWPAIGTALREAAKMRHSHHARGVALACLDDIWLFPAKDAFSRAWPIFKTDVTA